MKFPVTETWTNAYTLSGLAPGSELAIKPSGAAVYIVIGGSQPTIQPQDGDDIQPFKYGFVPSGHDAVWIACAGQSTTAIITEPLKAVLQDEYLTPDIVRGNRSLTMQTITEASVKLGKQRVISARFTVPAGQSVYIGFTTTDLPFVITGRSISQNGSTEIRYSAEEGRTYTGGTVIEPRNPNRITQEPIGISAKHTVTPNATAGTIYLDPYSIFGSGPASSRIGGDVSGLEYPLKPATAHVFTVSNTGSGSADVFWWITGYEGAPNLPYS